MKRICRECGERKYENTMLDYWAKMYGHLWFCDLICKLNWETTHEETELRR
jgi:hypothetical protein